MVFWHLLPGNIRRCRWSLRHGEIKSTGLNDAKLSQHSRDDKSIFAVELELECFLSDFEARFGFLCQHRKKNLAQVH